MNRNSMKRLQQAQKLARQAAAQMRDAAALADQAAQLFQQALAQAYCEQSDEESTNTELAVPSAKHKKQPVQRAKSTLLEKLTPRAGEERFSLTVPLSELPRATPETYTWDEGDEWWKPLQPQPTSASTGEFS